MWVLFGAVAAYSALSNGDNFFGVICIFFCLAGILVWLDARAIAWPLMVWFGLVVVACIINLALREFRWRPVWAMIFAIYSIYELNQWAACDRRGIRDHFR
jgi:hypothetical protein